MTKTLNALAVELQALTFVINVSVKKWKLYQITTTHNKKEKLRRNNKSIMKKLTAWEHIKAAHDHLLIAYSMIDVTQFYADTVNRALRASALSMGQIKVELSSNTTNKQGRKVNRK